MGSNGLICSMQPVGQLLAGADRDARNVVDRLLGVKLGALAARPVENVDQMGFQLGEAKLKHGEQADRARANNDNVGGGLVRLHRFRPLETCIRTPNVAKNHFASKGYDGEKQQNRFRISPRR